MKYLNNRAIWGILLVGAGLVLLLQNLNLFSFLWGSVWTAFFALGGLAFLAVFLSQRQHWWAIIPGLTLLGLSALIGLEATFPKLGSLIGGSLFLGAIGSSFWVIYLRDRDHWWALIPGGVLYTLAAVAVLGQIWPGVETGSVFFLGLAATFGLVYLLPGSKGRMNWALIPAAVLLALGLLTLLATWSFTRFFWAAALIVLGGFLIFRTLRGSASPASEDQESIVIKHE